MPGPFSLTIQPRKQKALGTRLDFLHNNSQFQPNVTQHVFQNLTSHASFPYTPQLSFNNFPLPADRRHFPPFRYTVYYPTFRPVPYPPPLMSTPTRPPAY
jgi:hypothetical protein